MLGSVGVRNPARAGRGVRPAVTTAEAPSAVDPRAERRKFRRVRVASRIDVPPSKNGSGQTEDTQPQPVRSRPARGRDVKLGRNNTLTSHRHVHTQGVAAWFSPARAGNG